MFFNFVGAWLVIALLLYAFSPIILQVILPFWPVIFAGGLIGVISFFISASYHKKFFAELTDKILEKVPSLPLSEAENIYQNLSETVVSLLNHDSESNERLDQNEAAVSELRNELEAQKRDQDEQLAAISDLYE